MPDLPKDSPIQLLFVCTGNTCRSAMAQGIARAALAPALSGRVIICSAGTHAVAGSLASETAVRICRDRGVDIADHRARPLSPELVEASHLILGMQRSHIARARELGAGDRTFLLSAFPDPTDDRREIHDPFGGGEEDFVRTFAIIEEEVRRVLAHLALALGDGGRGG